MLCRFNPPLQQAEWWAFAWKIPAVLTKSSDVFDENNVLLSPSFLNDEKILKLHCYHLWYNGLMFRFQLHGHKNIQRIYIHWLWKGILLHKVNALYKKNYNLIIMQISQCFCIDSPTLFHIICQRKSVDLLFSYWKLNYRFTIFLYPLPTKSFAVKSV